MSRIDKHFPTLQSAVAEEMRLIRGVLEELAEVLVSDEYFVSKYLDQLQAFDLLIQCTDESAAVLDRMAEGATSHDAIAPVRLTMVQDRLRAALDHGG